MCYYPYSYSILRIFEKWQFPDCHLRIHRGEDISMEREKYIVCVRRTAFPSAVSVCARGISLLHHYGNIQARDMIHTGEVFRAAEFTAKCRVSHPVHSARRWIAACWHSAYLRPDAPKALPRYFYVSRGQTMASKFRGYTWRCTEGSHVLVAMTRCRFWILIR